MMIMRPPQHGHGCESGLGSLASAQLVSPASGCAAGTSSKWRARAMLSARVPLANRPLSLSQTYWLAVDRESGDADL